jgi:hypothetical protein
LKNKTHANFDENKGELLIPQERNQNRKTRKIEKQNPRKF